MTKFKICGLRDAGQRARRGGSGRRLPRLQLRPRRAQADSRSDDARAAIGELREPMRPDNPARRGPVRRPAGGRGEPHRSTPASLDLVQLCGEESRDYMGLIRAPVDQDGQGARRGRPGRGRRPTRCGTPTPSSPTATWCMLDRIQVPGAKGGTGHTFDWRVAAQNRRAAPHRPRRRARSRQRTSAPSTSSRPGAPTSPAASRPTASRTPPESEPSPQP